MRETKQASKIITELRSKNYNCYVINIAGSQYQQPGLPDCLIIDNGHYIFVEFKGVNTEVKKHQEVCQNRLKQHGAKVYELRFMDDKWWMIDMYYNIRFKTFKEGVRIFYDTIMGISR